MLSTHTHTHTKEGSVVLIVRYTFDTLEFIHNSFHGLKLGQTSPANSSQVGKQL